MKKFFTAGPLYLLIALVNVGVFIAIWAQSGYGDLTNATLLDWGANFAPLTLTGEPWRLLSSAFLHAGWQHLILNMYMLLLLGSVMERVAGTWRFGAVYLLSALGGSLGSAFWFGYHETSRLQFVYGEVTRIVGIHPVVSVGASGALMGLAGAACALVLCHPNGWPREAAVRISGKAILQVVLINLVYGFITEGIDQAANIDGLIAGFVAGIILFQGEDPAGSWFRRVVLPLLCAGLGSALIVFAAKHGQSEELLEWKSALAAQQAQDAAAQAQEKAHQEAMKEAKAADDMAREDERRRPAPVDLATAAGAIIALNSQPDSMLIGASGNNAYVTSNSANTLQVVDLHKHAVIQTIQGGAFKTGLDGCPINYCRGRGATGVAVSSDERYAYVASMREDSLARIDLKQGKVMDTVKLGRFPRNVALTTAGDRIFVFNGVDDTISVVSITHWPQVLATLRLSEEGASNYAYGRPLSMWLSRDDKRLFAIPAGADAVLAFDTQTYQLAGKYLLDGYARAMPTSSGNGVWLFGARGRPIAWADPDTMAVRKTYPVCADDSTWPLATNSDGSLIAVENYARPVLQVVKVATRRAMGDYPSSAYVSDVLFDKDGKTFYAIGGASDEDSKAGKMSILNLDQYVKPVQETLLCPYGSQ